MSQGETDERNPSRRRRERARSVASELREYAGGRLDVGHQDVSPAAVLVADDDLRDLLIFAEQTWDRRKAPGDPDFWELRWVRDRLRPEASRVVTDAVDRGQLGIMEYVTGLPEWENDVSTLHTVRKLEDWLVHKEQCRLIYMAGMMGNGKTSWSLSMLQVVAWVHRRLRQQADDPSTMTRPEFAANFAVETGREDVSVAHIDNYDDLVAWASGHDSDDELWFVFDEASTELTAQSAANAQDVAEIFAPFIKKMRKLGVNMIVIGHDGGDVHIAIRSLADYIAKNGLKSASVYDAIKKREPVGHKFDLSNIPDTSWDFGTDDTADWAWGSRAEDVADGQPVRDTFDPSASSGAFSADAIREWRDSVVQALKHENDMTYSEIADALGVSEGTVGNALA